MGYVGLAIRLMASACVAMLALSMLPPYWTYRSLAGLGVILLWAALKVAGDLPREPRTATRHLGRHDHHGWTRATGSPSDGASR